MALTGVDHKRLVEAHIGGDEEAFAAIVRAYYESLFAHAMRRTGDAHAAEDAVQETLSRAYRALPRFSGDYQLRAWLHRILTNVCHDEGRRRQRESLTFERVAATHSEVPPVDHDLALLDLPRREVLDALAALPESYRDALVLRYVQELSFHDVAEATGISEGNARLRVHRGRAALRRALAPLAGVFVFLAPLLRRGQRAALAAQLGADPHVAMVASSPVATRVAESGMTLVDKAPSLPRMIGVAASLVVPAAIPVVSDQVVATPPAAVAAPFEAEVAAPAGDGSAPSDGSAPAVAAVAAVASTTVAAEPTTTTTAVAAGAAVATDEEDPEPAGDAEDPDGPGSSDAGATPGKGSADKDDDDDDADRPEAATGRTQVKSTAPAKDDEDEEDDEAAPAPTPTEEVDEAAPAVEPAPTPPPTTIPAEGTAGGETPAEEPAPPPAPETEGTTVTTVPPVADPAAVPLANEVELRLVAWVRDATSASSWSSAVEQPEPTADSGWGG